METKFALPFFGGCACGAIRYECTAPPLRMVFWETTLQCNLSCRHCRRLRQSNPHELTTDEGRRLIDQIREISITQDGPGTVLVFSGGEPLIREDMFALADHARAARLPTALASNAATIDERTARRIAEAGIARVAISLDAPTAELHDRIRGQRGSFDRALRAMGYLRQSAVPVQINMTITRDTKTLFTQMVDLAQRCQAVALHVFLFVPVGCGAELGPDQMLDAEEAEVFLTHLHEVARAASVRIKPTCAPQYYRMLAQQGELTGGDTWHRFTRGCLGGINVCFVSNSGLVFPCGYLPVSAGDVRKTTLQEIWSTSPLFKQLRNQTSIQAACGSCEYLDCCGGCRARAYSLTGNFLGEDPTCTYGARRNSR